MASRAAISVVGLQTERHRSRAVRRAMGNPLTAAPAGHREEFPRYTSLQAGQGDTSPRAYGFFECKSLTAVAKRTAQL
jgi:hypothetical protein